MLFFEPKLKMKPILLILLSVFVLQPKTGITNTVEENQTIKKDTIEFSPTWNFTGRCEGLCNVYVGGTSTIKKINGILLEKGEIIEIFVKCPTKIRLRKGLNYKFLAEKLVLNSCTTIIDTTENTRSYCLMEEIK